ncbi:FHF complex subunit HOOK-interacting protein 2B isoform X2 [Alosa pseudoharengus]|uniref:FHF complex subunit HOOK-interacting protein 2B isoform X2 n=1 Tax=Alosa pseudoharengus TaxID=34774 RepID=UPI003F8C43D8
MDMLNKLTNLFQQALETREPTVNLLESFVDHWKGITNYYIETTDESRPVKQTDIPWRLKQMLDILVFEEQQQQVEETGPCLEYLLQHKILETLCTLGKAQYPPGMSQQVLLFFSKVLSQVQKPLLHIINAYRPVLKLIRLCGLPNAQTEKEEALFLFSVCTRVKKDPYVLNYILEVNIEARTSRSRSSSTSDEPVAAAAGVGVSEGRAGATIPENAASPPSPSSPIPPALPGQRGTPSASASAAPGPQATSGLIHVLMHLIKSQSRARLKALESVLLLAALPGEDSGVLLASRSPLCELLAQRLCELYSLIPSTLDPTDVLGFPLMHWRDQFPQTSEEERQSFPGSDQLTGFLCWLDYCQQLLTHAPKILSVKLAKEIHRQWLTGLLQPQLLQMSEAGILLHTALLSCSVRSIDSPALLAELVLFLLGSATHPERHADTHTDTRLTLRYKLIQHCDHLSDEISIATLRLFEELLQKPDRNIVANLVLRNLGQRGYAVPAAAGYAGEERHVADTLDESDELEEDPFFSDMYADSEFGDAEPLLTLPNRQEESRPSTQIQVAETVNSFLCLVPQEAKSSQHVQGAGYDTYVHDAHKMFKDCTALSLDWGWPDAAIDNPSPCSEFYEGHFLQVLFDRIARILEQPYDLNLQVTSVLSRLAVFPHPHLHEYLLDPYISLSPGARSLFSTLVRVIGELMQRIQHIPNFTDKLVQVRKELMGLEDETMVEHMALLRGVIVLEEFCKELAAIAFVKLPMEEQ